MIYQADAIANEFLDGRLGEISPMKLQKLVYYAHAWSLALFDQPLIEDRIEAWPYGPVVPSLYFEFKKFGNGQIDQLALEIGDDLKETAPRIPDSDRRTKALVRKVWDMLGEYSAVQLSNMSHSAEEPWAKLPSKRAGLAIPNELIKSCFKDILAAGGGQRKS